jgi:hypothetical protein
MKLFQINWSCMVGIQWRQTESSAAADCAVTIAAGDSYGRGCGAVTWAVRLNGGYRLPSYIYIAMRNCTRQRTSLRGKDVEDGGFLIIHETLS